MATLTYTRTRTRTRTRAHTQTMAPGNWPVPEDSSSDVMGATVTTDPGANFEDERSRAEREDEILRSTRFHSPPEPTQKKQNPRYRIDRLAKPKTD